MSSATVELFDPELHYGLVCDWWREREVPEIPKSWLPKLGAVAYVDGVPRCAAWAVMSNSNGIAYLEWFIGNPVGVHKMKRASEVLVDFLCDQLRQFGYTHLFANVSKPIAEFLTRDGEFFETRDNVVQLARTI